MPEADKRYKPSREKLPSSSRADIVAANAKADASRLDKELLRACARFRARDEVYRVTPFEAFDPDNPGMYVEPPSAREHKKRWAPAVRAVAAIPAKTKPGIREKATAMLVVIDTHNFFDKLPPLEALAQSLAQDVLNWPK